MSLPRYSAYKDSGVKWLGEVPGHWKVRSLRYAATIQNGSDFKDCEVAEGGYPVLGSGGEFARISKFIYDQPSVLLGRKGTIDKPLYTEEPFWTVDTLFYTKIATDTHPKFFYWFCTSIPFDYFQFGSAVPSMTQNDLYGIKVPTPSIVEQYTIAAFLDRETGKIDALIAEQRRLVELLAEKRQAVISHAVTKGLNLNARMKDSGIEWLGDVPAHWEVKRLKRSLQLLTEKTDRRDNPIALENIQGWSGRFIPTETEFEGEGVAFECGDILFGKLRPYLAKVYLAESSGEAVGDFHVMRPAPKIDGRFVVYQMLSRDFITIVDSSTFGAKMPRVAWDFMSNMMLAIPPKAEQQSIAAFLDTETAKFDTLTAEANRAIALLQERRSALISAAVTGKIDIRKAA